MREEDQMKAIENLYFHLQAERSELKRTIQNSQARISLIDEITTDLEVTLRKNNYQHVYEGFVKVEREEGTS